MIEEGSRMPLISLSGVSRKYEKAGNQVMALQGIDLAVEPGEFVTLWGPSGSGKSTLLNIIGLLDQPTAGSYRFGEREVKMADEGALAVLRARHIGFVFQGFNLLPHLRAWQNVALPNKYTRGLKPDQARQRAEELLDLVGLRERATHFPSELSGGEEQRVAIARALMNDPELILADEPTGNLDSKNHEHILDLLKEANRLGKTLVIASHNPDFVEAASRVVRLRDGKVLVA
jgi:putative ABC transport system ATP-binding protein